MQDALLAAGGAELLLASCTLDEAAPLAREWALWSVRNLCSGNERVQDHIAALAPVEAVQSPELTRMGMEVRLDQATHKLQLVPVAGAPPPPV